MMNPEELSVILDRLVERKQTEADMVALRQVLNDIMTSGVTSEQRQIVIQLGKYNVNIGEEKELRIGDYRTFREVNDETMKALTRALPHLNQFKWLIEDKTKGFVGRTYVFDAIQSFINNNPKGYFTIIGDPGQGKSAILAKYVQDTGCIAHFNLQFYGINRAEQFLESVCRQLVIRYDLPYDPLPPRATQDGEFLSQLLEEVARKADGQAVVIAVDALDKVDLNSQSVGANVLYLPASLPDGVYFILTRRPVSLVSLPLVVNNQRIFDLMQYPAENRQDVERYIRRSASESPSLQKQISSLREKPTLDEFVTTLADKSENNFMYLIYLLSAIERGVYQDLSVENLPQGLQNYYYHHWQRMGMSADELPRTKIKIVYVLAELLEPVSRQLISEFTGERESTVQEVLDEWQQFLHIQRVDRQNCYTFYHASFRDFLHRQDIVQAAGVTISGIRALIADNLSEELGL